jgi:IS1 family transposase
VQFQKYRERYEVEKAVDQYKKDKIIEELERKFDYCTDEESMYSSFHDEIA